MTCLGKEFSEQDDFRGVVGGADVVAGAADSFQ
ncbi:hypothetical protein AWB82_06273 [Caballeronia glebae]|uniref:Uncharacterized protein n=1 Tax=Caballeronia glebae TaxID=1777143 RepID=A0A158D480_9BURK|nr:hypothetical protein AWB82_06273 [Caballeronia glebae]